MSLVHQMNKRFWPRVIVPFISHHHGNRFSSLIIETHGGSRTGMVATKHVRYTVYGAESSLLLAVGKFILYCQLEKSCPGLVGNIAKGHDKMRTITFWMEGRGDTGNGRYPYTSVSGSCQMKLVLPQRK